MMVRRSAEYDDPSLGFLKLISTNHIEFDSLDAAIHVKCFQFFQLSKNTEKLMSLMWF